MPNPPPPGYVPVPVNVAASVCHNYDKQAVVVLSFDLTYNMIHTSTFGRSPADKVAAAYLGERLCEYAGANLKDSYDGQDFRAVEKAEYAALEGKLKDLVQGLAADVGRFLLDTEPSEAQWIGMVKTARHHLRQAKELLPDLEVNL